MEKQATPVPYGALVRQFQSPPAGKLYCLHGDRSVFRVSLYAASRALLNGHCVALVDGSNSFDLYYVAEFARRVTAFRQSIVRPDHLLERLYIARAFTCYQMEATITERVMEFVRAKHIPVVIIFGLLNTFYDEQAPLFEVKASLQRILTMLQHLKRADVSVLVAMRDAQPPSKERAMLFPSVCTAMDEVFAIAQTEEELHVVRETERTSLSARQRPVSRTVGRNATH